MQYAGTATAVQIWNDDNNILLGYREVDQQWGFPGGKVDFGESLKTGASRELQEETSIIVPENHLRYAGFRQTLTHQFHYVTHFYSAWLPTDQTAIVTEPEKLSKWHWFSYDEIRFMIQSGLIFLPTKAYYLAEQNDLVTS